MLNQSNQLDRVIGALADPTRRAIVERLGASPASITELAGPLSMSLPAVLQHVQVLERSGLVATEKIGRVRSCRLELEPLDNVQHWIAARRRTWERRLDQLGRVVATHPSTESPHGESTR